MTVCQFCEVFGKEEAIVERKCSRSDRVKYFKAPFLKENFSSHNKRMYSAKCTECFDLGSGAKKLFFGIGSTSG